MTNELYIIGDQSRMVVKNLILQLIKTDCRVNVYPPLIDELDNLPRTSIQLLVLLSDNIEFLVIKKIASLQAQYNYNICFIGRIPNLSIDNDKYFKQIPSIKLESYTVNVEKLLDLMDKYNCNRKRILVVDDEPIILRSIKIWLDNEFDLFLVNSGEMALQFLDTHIVDLVLLDYKMPTMDGPRVLEAIRANDKLRDLPVIFLTANNDRQSVITAMQYKPDGYILKSKSPDEIKSAVVDFFKSRLISG